jgi:plasmid stabilization system protein ParE
MRLNWTSKAISDLNRIYQFLAVINRRVAVNSLTSIERAAYGLLESPRIGYRLEEFRPKDVRSLVVGEYVVRYQIKGEESYILRIWHGKEDR